MRRRFVAVLLALGFAVLAGPVAFAQASEVLQGTLRGPDGDPVSGVAISVLRDGDTVGKATTGKDGKWKVDLPDSGTYTVRLDTDTLPKRLVPRSPDAATLRDVRVTPDQQRTVIFPLVRKGDQQKEETTTATPGATQSPTEPQQRQRQQEGPSMLVQLLRLFVKGIQFGAIIAITTVGLSLVFGTTRIINFAHGELVTLGAAVALFFNAVPSGPGWHLIPAAAIAVVAGGGTGAALHSGLWRPLERRGTGRIQLLIISIGLSLLLRHLILVLLGSRSRPYVNYTVQDSISLGPIAITPRDLIITVGSLGVLLLFAIALKTTRIGKAMRAVADNRQLAEASGIDVNRVVLVVWVVGSALAALGGVLYGLSEVVAWDMGFKLLLLMFAGMILGGLGTAYGAMVGSLIIGLVAQMSTLVSPVELQYAWALFAMVVVLLLRPQGIFGRRERIG